jgi:hypothetical protein
MEVKKQFDAPTALPSGKETVPIQREAEWATKPVQTRWRRETIPALPGIELRLASSLLTILTKLPWLLGFISVLYTNLKGV